MQKGKFEIVWSDQPAYFELRAVKNGGNGSFDAGLPRGGVICHPGFSKFCPGVDSWPKWVFFEIRSASIAKK